MAYLMSRAKFIIFFTWIACIPVFSQIGEKDWLFQEFSVNNGLSQYDVTSIVQDSIGYIWIGTYDGLNRYNGFENKVFRHDNNLPNTVPGNRVLCLTADNKGNIWIGTEDGGLGVYNIHIDKFMHIKSENAISPSTVSSIFVDGDNLLVGTSYGNIYNSEIRIIRDTAFVSFELVKLDKENFLAANNYVSSLAKINNTILVGFLDGELIQLVKGAEGYTYNQAVDEFSISDILIDNENQIWVGTFTGLKCYKYLDGYNTIIEITPKILLSNSDYRITSISQDVDGNIWYTTYLNGLFQLKKTESYSYKIENFSTKNSTIGIDNLSTTYIDRSNTLWCGSHNDGMRIVDLYQKEFYKASFYNRTMSTANTGSQNLVTSSCFVDHNENLWVGIQEKGLFQYTTEGQTNHFTQKTGLSGLSSNTITNIIEDKNKNLWFTSWQGLYMLSNKNYLKGNYIFQQVSPELEYSESINNDSHFSICEDIDGNIWLGGYSGLYKLIVTNGECTKIINYSSEINKNDLSHWVMSLAADKQRRTILAGTKGGGLYQIKYNKSNSQLNISNFYNSNSNKPSISKNIWVIKIFENNAWVGTDQGLNVLNSINGTYTITKQINTNDGLLSNKIVSIEMDFDDNIWLGTGLGLSKISSDHISISNYDFYDGLQSNSFNETSAIDDNGRLFFGGINGLNYFYPEQISDDYSVPNVKITNFYIGNKEITPGLKVNNKVAIKTSIPFVDHIHLDYFNSDFSIYFQSFNFSAADNNVYEYKIDGYDKDWLSVKGNNRVATYSNLPYGEHTFYVRLASFEKYKQSSTQELSITVSRPPWLTWWAYTAYTLFVLALLFFIIRYFIEQSRHKNEILIEKHKREQIQELNEMKIRFFMNISHELRTPLTLIMQPLQLLKEQKFDDLKLSKYIDLAGLNAQKLHHLINQLLEFRQTETGNKSFSPEKGNVVEFVRSIYDSFTSLTDKKSIKFNFECHEKSIIANFDKDIIDKIMSNLISNALKFTPSNGSISISLNLEEQEDIKQINISVSDTGIGIAADKLEKIFERFYQNKCNSGFGIGLAFSNNLAKIHNGSLAVESQPKQGATFTLTIPFLEPVEDDSSAIETTIEQNKENSWITEEYASHGTSATKKLLPDEDSVILLAEDNKDLREFVSSFLCERYIVITAENGKDALELASTKIPDLIISDIMMPEMDGIELAKNLASNEKTNHIPIIFLTAKDKHTDQLVGFDTGAVDYIIKPFNVLYLQKKIDNLLHTLKLQQDKSRSAFLSVPKEKRSEPYLNHFINTAHEIIKKNLTNSNFDVTMFCEELGVSRMQLHRKIKGSLGQSTTEFIRSVRIKHAAELLRHGQHNVTQAMYEAGFDNPSYFTKSFKKIYGVNPSEFNTSA